MWEVREGGETGEGVSWMTGEEREGEMWDDCSDHCLSCQLNSAKNI